MVGLPLWTALGLILGDWGRTLYQLEPFHPPVHRGRGAGRGEAWDAGLEMEGGHRERREEAEQTLRILNAMAAAETGAQAQAHPIGRRRNPLTAVRESIVY